jgi:hypothetical protein
MVEYFKHEIADAILISIGFLGTSDGSLLL